MKRREFLAAGGLAAVAAASGSQPQSASAAASDAVRGETWTTTTAIPPEGKSDSYGLRHGSEETFTVSLPAGSPIVGSCDLALRVLREIAALSEGRIGFQAAGFQALVRPGDGIDITFGTEHQMFDHNPAFAYFAGLPGPDALTAASLHTWLRSGGGNQAWAGLALDAGYHPLAIAHLGDNPPLFVADGLSVTDGPADRKTAPVPTTLAGRRIATLGLTSQVAAGLGASTIGASTIGANTLDLQNTGFTSIGRTADRLFVAGDVDSYEGAGLYQALQLGIFKRAGSAISPGLAPSGSVMCMRITCKRWHAMTSARQNMIAAAAASVFDETLAANAALEATARHIAAGRFKVSFAQAPPVLTDQIAQVSRAAIAHAAGHDAAARQIDDTYWAFAKSFERPGRRPMTS